MLVLLVLVLLSMPVGLICVIVSTVSSNRKTKAAYQQINTQLTYRNEWKQVAASSHLMAAYVNEQTQEIALFTYESQTTHTLNFTDILACEIIENNATVQTTSIAGAVVGGAIAGSVGAIIGSQGSAKVQNQGLFIRIITKNLSNPVILLTLLLGKVDKASELYKNRFEYANRVYAVISIIIHHLAEENDGKNSS